MKRYIRNSDIAERLEKNGCTIRVTSGEGIKKTILEERFVTPEEIAASNERREENLRSRHIQT